MIAFNPAYLADALEIGSFIMLTDPLSPALVRHPNGNFCVLMCMRVTVGTAENITAPRPAAEAPAEARAA